MTSTIRHLRDCLRPIISGDVEYHVRRRAYRFLPVSESGYEKKRVVHACVWKTASQWVRLVLSDPRIYCRTGHFPFVSAQVQRSTSALANYRATPNSFLLAAYGSVEDIERLMGAESYIAFFVVRDPRLMLVSWYYSTRFTHLPTIGVNAHRTAMAGMDESEAFEYCANAFIEEFGPILDSWAKVTDTHRIVHFEDLTGSNKTKVWSELLGNLGFNIPSGTLSKVLSTYSMEKLAKGGHNGAQSDKYASRGKRDWPDFLSIGQNERIRGRLQGWVHSFSYE